MSYREIPPDKILKFPATPGFKGWKRFFTHESTTHPAKMNLNLLRWILRTYTEPGEVLLDPMAGTGSTVVLAALTGRNGVAVEYEPTFCELINGNIELAGKHGTLTTRGRMVCIQGDARELSKLLGESDAIITSPPYAYESTASKRTKWRESQNFKTGHDKEAPYSEEDYRFRKDKDRGNIGKLALFRRVPCPPEEATFHDKRPERKGTKWEWQKEIKLEADTIVTSPPYGNRLSDVAVNDGDPARMGYKQAIDSIVTSPPYEQTTSSKQHGRDPKPHLAQGGIGCENINLGYSDDEDNIGNLKRESYLEAMLQVYRECHKVLKNAGVMILVTKNFIRDKAVVRLDSDTIKLCESAGFRLSDRWYFKLPTRSFWRILYRRKYPDVPEVEYEDVLVFMKGVDILDKKV